ncbi:MAG: hypothetical protein ACK4Q5_06745 [Saprospiraceae bacterium]
MPTNDSPRFADSGATLSDFATHFVVHCPKCEGRALIRPADGKPLEPPIFVQKTAYRLTCTACFHVEESGHWHGAMRAFVAVKCRECHAPIHREADWDGHWKKLATRCDACGDTCEYEAHISKYPRNAGRVADPAFGLPLWLQADFRDEVLWAYNFEQLDFLAAYIAAKLRERGISPRNTISKNSAMVGRLPTFIKKASNRPALLKLIEQLRNKT